MTRDEIISQNPIVEFARSRGHELRPAGQNFVTNGCPVTEHKKKWHRPVSIDVKKQFWFCNDCKVGGTVIDWVMRERGCDAAQAMRELGLGRNDHEERGQILCAYDYTDEGGNLLFQCVRTKPKDFWQRRPDGKGGWINNLQGVRRVLYLLPEVKSAQTVCVAEGEKDADNLAKLGFVATTNPLGAGKWRDEYSETLRGKDVIVFGDVGDDDGAGEKHTRQVIESLTGKAKSIKHVALPGGFHDVSDYIASLPHETARDTIRKLIDETQRVELRPLADGEPVELPPPPPPYVPPPRKSAATELVQLADKFEFFHDRQDRPFVRLENGGHSEVWPVESTKFRKLLARIFYKRTGRAISRNALADAITTLAGRACHGSPEEPVFQRVAPHGENILIDLCDPQWRVVEVTPNGWQILEKSPVAFVRTGSMQSLPLPVQGNGSIAPLWDLLNVTPKQRPLVAGALLNYFHPHGPYFVTNFVGEQGTAKTCGARILRQLVDPNENPLRSPPKEERDLLAQAASNWCVALDNLSSLPIWLSDALSRLATGGGHSARTLYTDLDEISLAVKRPVILNGIEDVATRPDLAERVLQIELETISDEKRITEKDLWLKFDKQWPTIFCGLLDALVCAVRELSNVRLDLLPRMADAALFATAGETAFRWKRGTFMAAYWKNLREGAIASVEAHPIGVAIRQLLEKENEWSGEPAQLLKTLNNLVSDEERHPKSWPQNARSLGHCLRRLAQALRRAGISFERDKGKRRVIYLSKAPEKTSQTSPNLSEKDNGDVSGVLFPPLHASLTDPAGDQTPQKKLEI
jgi:5S rRNA maturation endonuclease (ribonuclease M5)